MNAREMVEAWDRDESIPSVSMGGLGEDYEVEIQNCAIEFVRAILQIPDLKLNAEGNMSKEDKDRILKARDEAFEKASKTDKTISQISGAMFGTATNLAVQLCVYHDGPEALIEDWVGQGMPVHRKIRVKKDCIVEGSCLAK